MVRRTRQFSIGTHDCSHVPCDRLRSAVLRAALGAMDGLQPGGCRRVFTNHSSVSFSFGRFRWRGFWLRDQSLRRPGRFAVACEPGNDGERRTAPHPGGSLAKRPEKSLRSLCLQCREVMPANPFRIFDPAMYDGRKGVITSCLEVQPNTNRYVL